jgi:hypothetical protein
VKDRVARHRSRYIDAPLTVVPEKPLQPAQAPATRLTDTPYFNPHGPTPRALQGDDYQLEYYDDGYPKLPSCLCADRRRVGATRYHCRRRSFAAARRHDPAPAVGASRCAAAL